MIRQYIKYKYIYITKYTLNNKINLSIFKDS